MSAVDALRAAVVAGRMMRARQRYYTSTARKHGYAEASQAEEEFDRLSLEAVKLDQQEKERDQ
jgi:hypothetical protein